MFKKIFKIFLMVLLVLWLCGLLFSLYGNVDVFSSAIHYTAGTVSQTLSVIIILLALVKNKETKVFLLGFWPALSIVIFVLLPHLNIQLGIPSETFFVLFMFFGLLLQLFILEYIISPTERLNFP